MRQKHGVVAVIFDEKGGTRHFLLLHRALNWKGWEFCKGGIDGTEKPQDAIFREIDEETGLTHLKVVKILPMKMAWIAKDIQYNYTPFIVHGDMNEEIDLEQEIIEHDGHKWAQQHEVEKMLTHEDNRRLFREAVLFLDSIK